MRKFFALLFVLLITFGFVFQEAEAKRFGGGRSFGVSRSTTSSFSRPQSAAASAQRNAVSSPWMNRLAGFAFGGLLAYLLMSNGLASGILSWLLLGGVILLIVNFIRHRTQIAAQSHVHAYQQPATRENNVFNAPSRFMNRETYIKNDATQAPAGFDTTQFLQTVKNQFMVLQAAYDSKDMAVLRDLTTPQVLSEIKYQLHERGDTSNVTEVVTLDAMVLEIAKEPDPFDPKSELTMVSVRFSGMIRETAGEAATSFNEIWHFQQEANDTRWMVAGIQQ